MAFDVPTLLRMLGIDPKDVLGKVEELQTIAKHFEGRLAAIEEKQDRIIALLETLHDDNATLEAMQHDGNAVLEVKNGVHPEGATIYSTANVGGKVVTFNPSGPINT